MKTKKIIVLDFEGVVFQSRLREMYKDIFTEKGKSLNELDYFFSDIFKEQDRSSNCRQKTIAEMTEPLAQQHPEWAEYLRAFNADREFYRYIKCPIEGMEEIINTLSSSDEYQLYGLTNWPGDGFVVLEKLYPELISKFKKVIVSGYTGYKKPDPEFFQLANKEIGEPEANSVYFFDDKKRNVEAAKQLLGWNGFTFEDASTIKNALFK